MAVIVWFTVGLAIWHYTVFFDDRLWGGIIGALLVSVGGATLSGTIFQIASGRGIGETDLITVAVAIPGTLAGLAFGYVMAERRGEHGLT